MSRLISFRKTSATANFASRARGLLLNAGRVCRRPNGTRQVLKSLFWAVEAAVRRAVGARCMSAVWARYTRGGERGGRGGRGVTTQVVAVAATQVVEAAILELSSAYTCAACAHAQPDHI